MKTISFYLFIFLILIIGCVKSDPQIDPNYHLYEGRLGKQGNSTLLLNNSEILICANKENTILLYKLSTTGEMLWKKEFTTDLTVPIFGLAVTKDGDIFLCGSTNKKAPISKTDILLIKINQEGDKIWEKIYGTGFNENGAIITLSKDDNLILAASSHNSISFSNDLIIYKIDLEGNIVWEQTFQIENGDQVPVGIIETENEIGFMITGTVYFPDSTFSGGLIMLKLDQKGNIEWHKIGKKYFQPGFNGVETKNGDFIICGYNVSNFSSQTSTVKYDRFGNFLWERNYGQLEFEVEAGYIIRQNNDDSFTILGSVCNKDKDQEDVLILKINSNGDNLWYRTFGSSGDDIGVNLIKDLNDNNIITGDFNVTYGSVDHSLDRNGSIFMITIDADGDFK